MSSNLPHARLTRNNRAYSGTFITTIILLMLRPQQVAAQIPNPLHPHCQCRALCPLQAAYRYLTIHAHPHMSSSISIYLRAHFPPQLVIWQGSVMHMPIVSKLCTLHVHHPTHLRPNQSAAMDEKFWPPPRSQTLAKTRT
jgi:hypothetical protein